MSRRCGIVILNGRHTRPEERLYTFPVLSFSKNVLTMLTRQVQLINVFQLRVRLKPGQDPLRELEPGYPHWFDSMVHPFNSSAEGVAPPSF
jgi:hypothetical protein